MYKRREKDRGTEKDSGGYGCSQICCRQSGAHGPQHLRQLRLQKFQSIIEGLNNSWSSDVKTKFFTSYEQDLKALNEMVTQYSEVCAGLRSLADYHTKTEEEIKARIDKAGKAYG